ncbi:flavin reductase family protein [Microbacterium sulfonylureivorans]|uniref:flavin reductase family protein n=1 Tax=Microbacterium sulfonylureivorans TaxID=2486854 RepID=UPI000FDA29D0|nr:flavin reductase family protein [Microbacterium sulfonylureivorans]
MTLTHEIAANADLDIQPESSAPAGISPEELKAVFRDHPAGIAVITADAGDGPVAMTVSSVFSVSAAPPLIVFSASVLSSSTPTLQAAETVVIHMIDTDSLDLAVLCATSGVDRFADTDAWTRLETGEPVFHGVTRRVRARVTSRLDAGSSTVIVVHALEAWHDPEHRPQPLVYHNRTWHTLSDSSTIS